ncbi:uroplakin-1a [Hypomesus transpacificus]|uniref:uroplakin-1a n=1 Tax=Hypomesus transpacificus TaxID=137520 RepID=UPI001F0848F6|nr:uroplakin-1a [Hypomesus transpacificus]
MADKRGSTCLMVVVILGNLFAAAAGLALCALAIWVAVDSFGLYPLAKWSGKDDIFAGAWIAIFTGFAFFCTCIFGVLAALWRSKGLVLTYLILMLIIFIFECASCITAVTHRDYLVGNSNLMKKQMLTYYAADGKAGSEITLTWNRLMKDAQCCGADSPMDWIEYNSTFRETFGTVYPWPLHCCQKKNNYEIVDLEACKVGQASVMFTKGCFNYIETVFSRYTWAVSWYGFAVLMFIFWIMVLAMIYYVTL